MFFLLSWKEFSGRKLQERAEIVKGDDGPALMAKMKVFNAQKRLTTTDYKMYNLTLMFTDASLEIVEKIKEQESELEAEVVETVE